MADQPSDRELIAGLRELAGKATPGPWSYTPGIAIKHYVSSANGDLRIGLQELHWDDGREVPAAANAELIAAMHNALPRLLALAERGIEAAEQGGSRE